MEQFTIIKLDGSRIDLFSADPVSFVTQANQDHTLMSTDVLKMTFRSTQSIKFEVGDKIQIVNDVYTIRTTTTREIVDENLFYYEITFYGVLYELLKSQYRDADVNGVSYNSSFDLTYTLSEFIAVVVNNVNRDYPGTWRFDSANCPDTNPILMSFSKQNCLNALQTICSEFKYDFFITQSEGIRTIHVGINGQIINPPGGNSHFEWGKGSGLYRLKEKSVDDKSIISRLYAEGGTDNIKSDYRGYSHRLQLPLSRLNKNSHTLYDGTVIPAGSQTIGISNEASRYIEDTALSVKLGGVVEDTEHYDHIYPQRTGSVTAIDSDDLLSFTDTAMFDLTATDSAGNDLYMVDGVSPKITFITGKLSQQTFEIEAYDHTTKTFKLIQVTDERGLKFPSDAFQISVDDKYKLTDIMMPQSYIDDAEEDLWYAAYNDFLMKKQARVQYELTFDPMYFKDHLSDDVEVALFKPGDYIPVKDERFDLEKNIRITNVKRNLLLQHDYVLTLSDTHTISVIADTVQSVMNHENIIVRNRLRDLTRARLAWRTTEELRSMIFDTDNYFDVDNIRPLSIDTNMLTVGAKSQQFILSGVVMQANVSGFPNRFDATAGQLIHLTIDPDGVRTWNMGSISATLSETGGYYVYAKCSKEGDTGVWHITQQQLKAEDISDPNNYYFQVGIIGSLNTELSFRDFTTTYGFTRINGRTITTGRISSVNGKTYIDLDDNVISGNIRFLSEGNEQDLEEWSNDVVSDLDVVKGITDKFGTTIEGGLINTVMMQLREANTANITAGISGIQGEGLDDPSFWSGGNYEEAKAFRTFLRKIINGEVPDEGEYNALANIVFLHNGGAKTGALIVEPGGRIILIDTETGKERLVFNVTDIPDISELLSGVDFGDEVDAPAFYNITPSNPVTIATVNGVKSGSAISFKANSLYVTANQSYNANPSVGTTFKIELFRNGVYYTPISHVFLQATGGIEARSTSIDFKLTGMPDGNYSVRFSIAASSSTISASADISTSILKWEFRQQNVRYFQFGKNGMMAFFSNNHWYFTETGGLDIKGKTNIPGVLFSGSVALYGGLASSWGAKKHPSLAANRNSTGNYTVYHSVGHLDYQVSLTPALNRTCYVGSKTESSFAVYVYSTGNSPSLADSPFDFQIFGKNYT